MISPKNPNARRSDAVNGHIVESELIPVDSLSQVFASARIPVHLFLRITGQFEDEHPHEQSCADEGETFVKIPRRRERIDVGRYSVQAQGVTPRRSSTC
jgi:hypothetical protein